MNYIFVCLFVCGTSDINFFETFTQQLVTLRLNVGIEELFAFSYIKMFVIHVFRKSSLSNLNLLDAVKMQGIFG